MKITRGIHLRRVNRTLRKLATAYSIYRKVSLIANFHLNTTGILVPAFSTELKFSSACRRA